MSRLITCFILLVYALPQQALAENLLVYSSRKEQLIKPLFELYEKQTGHTISYITKSAKPLMQRLKAEGKHSPADLLITVDAGNLGFAAMEGLLSKIDSAALIDNVPAYLRDPEQRWYGLSMRARTIVYNTETVHKNELKSYEDLADPKWKGRLCLRTSKKVYNHSLIAMLVNRHGVKKTEEIVKGWVKNLANEPYSSDIRTMMAIVVGQCDVAIVNSYYFGRLMKQQPQIPLALFWPSGDNRGVHVNVSGAGVTQNAPHRKEAIKLLEWLSGEQAQHLFAKLNMEYPVNPRVEASDIVKSWGTFTADQSNLASAARLQSYAIRLIERAGYR